MQIKSPQRIVRSSRLAWMLAACSVIFVQAFIAGGASARDIAGAQKEFHIPRQSLSSALIAFGVQAGVQFSVDAALTANRNIAGLNGRYSIDEGLRVLLDGTDLVFQFTAPDTVTIEKAPNGTGLRRLDTLKVEGATQAAGVNGSTDVTATEGTGSYTSDALTVGSKVPMSIRETPQSVSVITQQRMQDQNLTDLSAVLGASTGITMVTGLGGPLGPTFYSRGFQINSFQLDGGAPLSYNLNTAGYTPQFDMAEYDHVEILRGADGLFAGAGEPAGVVNLVRKRPLDHDQLIVEGKAGSWNNYQSMLDVTGPLAFDGKVRGRFVADYQNQDYFYTIAKENHTLLYGVLEADLTSSTLLTVGSSYLETNTVPWNFGLPRYYDGADLDLPRSTGLTFPWNREDFSTTEIFARLEQRIGDNWSLKLNTGRVQQTTHEAYDFVTGPIVQTDLSGAYARGYADSYDDRQYLADLTLHGAFELFGQRQQLVVGVDWKDAENGGTRLANLPFCPADPDLSLNVFQFDPSACPEPPIPPPAQTYPTLSDKQFGAYITLRLQVLDRLHLLGGARISTYWFDSVLENLANTGAVTSTTNTHYRQGAAITPYGGVVYDLSHDWSLYASYTNIFLSQANRLEGPLPGTPAPPLTGDSYEGGLKGDLRGGALKASFSIFRINENNELGADPNYPPTRESFGYSCCVQVVGNEFSEGFEAEVTGQILPHWQIYAGYTYDFNKVDYGTEIGTPIISLAPKHMLHLWTTYQLPARLQKWTVGGGVDAQSTTYVSGTTPSGFDQYDDPLPPYIPFNFTQGSYAVFSGRVSYQISSRFAVALNINNIFDKTYYKTVDNAEYGNWYGDPRNIMLTFRYKN